MAKEISVREIQEDIKSGQLKKAYLLYGEEGYLIRQYRDNLLAALSKEGDTMNTSHYQGKNVPLGEIIDLAETLPFFAERRVIVLESTELFKSGGEQLAEYLAAPAETTTFLFVETEIDKRSKLYKAVDKLGRAVEFPRMDDTTLRKWVLGLLKKEGKQISTQALELFLEDTGNDMQNIRQELEKLLCYCLNREAITEQDVEEVCIRQISSQIFKMTDAISEGNQKRALQLYYDLIATRQPVMQILYMVTRQFNILFQVKELVAKGYQKQAIAEKVGLRPYIAGQYMAQCKGFTRDRLRAALDECADTEYRIKSGLIDQQIGLEMLLVKYSRRVAVANR